MQQGELTPYRKDRGRQLLWLFRIGIVGLLLAGWYIKCAGPITVVEHHFAVDRQTIFNDIHVVPTTIVQMQNGDLAVAGTIGAAWAADTDASGKLLWTYQDAGDDGAEGSGNSMRSQFHGAVPLKNGNILFCGEKRSEDRHMAGLITVLGGSGQLVDRRVEMPSDGETLTNASFFKCLAWEDGVLVLGDANQGTKGYLWIMRLDSAGAKQSQTLVDFAQIRAAEKAQASSEPSFVLALYNSDRDFNVVRLDIKGTVIAKRTIPGEWYLQMRSVEPTKKTWVVSYVVGPKATLYTLDEQLEDEQKPKEIGSFDATQGFGFAFPDNSLALFGRTDNAAVQWVDKTGQHSSIAGVAEKYKTYVINDAQLISPNQFVAVRDSVSAEQSNRGLMISWLTLK
jgi:hypothetical protein